MKKKILILIIICGAIRILELLVFICLIFIASIDKNIYYWEPNYGVDEISEIRIIDCNNYPSSYNVTCDDYTLVMKIDCAEYENLFNELKSIPYKSRNYGLPRTPTDLSFMVIYVSGDYDIVSKSEIYYFKFEKYTGGHYSRLKCNDLDKFNEIINSYLDSINN